MERRQLGLKTVFELLHRTEDRDWGILCTVRRYEKMGTLRFFDRGSSCMTGHVSSRAGMNG